MTATRARLLVVLAIVGAVAGWALTRLVDAYVGRSLPVPWTAPVVMALLALAIVLWTRGTRARLARKPGTRPIEPIVAARSAALAMAGSRTGAVVAGFYVGVALALSGSLDVPYVRGLVLLALATAVASGAVVAASLWLERVCRIPPGASGVETP